MSITINDILEMEEMNDAYTLAGSTGNVRKVNSITVLDAPDGIRFLKGSEFVLTTMYPFFRDEDKIEGIIEELALRNISGLGLKLNRYLNKLSTAAIKVANQYNLPIIVLPPEKPWIELMVPIMSEILKINNRQLIKSREINKQFTQILLMDSDLKEIAELLYHYMDVPIGIYNLIENDIVCFPNDSIPSCQVVWDFLQSKHVSFESIDDNSHLSLLTYNGSSYHVLSFENGKDIRGVILVELADMKLDQDKINTLLHAKNASIIKFKSIQIRKEHNNRFKQDFILELLVKKMEEKDLPQYRRKAWEMGLDLRNRYILLAISKMHIELEELYQMLDKLERHYHLNEDLLIGLDKENNLIMLIPADDNESSSAFMNRIKGFIDQLQGFFNKKWAFGISQVQNINSIPVAYHQGIKALYHGIKFGGYGKVQFHENLGIYRLFSHPAIEEEIKVFVKETLSPVLDYEVENEIDLAETLKVFIENRGNYRKTGNILHLHHNTVRYRINIINQITDFNIDNHHMYLQYQLAFSLLPLIKK